MKQAPEIRRNLIIISRFQTLWLLLLILIQDQQIILWHNLVSVKRWMSQNQICNLLIRYYTRISESVIISLIIINSTNSRNTPKIFLSTWMLFMISDLIKCEKNDWWVLLKMLKWRKCMLSMVFIVINWWNG